MAVRARRACHPRVKATTITEPRTKFRFPQELQNVQGTALRCLGATVRTKPPLGLAGLPGLARTAVAMYGDPGPLSRDLRSKADEDLADDVGMILLDAACNKMVAFRAKRATNPGDLIDELSGPLEKRAQLMGTRIEGMDELKEAVGSRTMERHDVLCLLWRLDQSLLVSGPANCPDGELNLEFSQPIASPGLCRGLFEGLLGEDPVYEQGKSRWVTGAQQLMQAAPQ